MTILNERIMRKEIRKCRICGIELVDKVHHTRVYCGIVCKSTVNNLTGKKFGRLTVIDKADVDNNGCIRWNCICDCGKLITTAGKRLINGGCKSCGCYKSELTAIRNKKNATGIKKRTKEYNTWANMKARCSRLEDNRYGGRGISVCDRWKNSFKNFLFDMGRAPTPMHSIDRINNDGNYEPLNCRWATSYQQTRNTRLNHWIEYNGEEMIIQDWGKRFGINTQSVQDHLNKGETMSEIDKYFKEYISKKKVRSAKD